MENKNKIVYKIKEGLWILLQIISNSSNNNIFTYTMSHKPHNPLTHNKEATYDHFSKQAETHLPWGQPCVIRRIGNSDLVQQLSV